MNGRNAKLIRKKSKELIVEWLKTLVDTEQGKCYNVNNALSFLPKQTHIYYQDRSYHLSSHSYKWFIKKVKRIYKEGGVLPESLRELNEN
tara:strand:+ start:649 stop:918 length:270 start_codon:yes stop_codon:yes gene_type:complete